MSKRDSKPIYMGEVPSSQLRPNSWNTNHVDPVNEQKLRLSIEEQGFFKPIIVRELADGSLEILGGQHRWQVAVEMGIKSVPIVNLGEISDVRAKEIGLLDNGRYGEDDTLALAELLKELGDDSHVIEMLPFSDDELESIFNSTSIAIDDLDTLGGDDDVPELEVERSKEVKTHTIMRFKIPLGDAEWVQKLIETTMNRQCFLADDTMSNAGNALVHLLKEHAK